MGGWTVGPAGADVTAGAGDAEGAVAAARLATPGGPVPRPAAGLLSLVRVSEGDLHVSHNSEACRGSRLIRPGRGDAERAGTVRGANLTGGRGVAGSNPVVPTADRAVLPHYRAPPVGVSDLRRFGPLVI
jgi:hypothetical protein